MDVTVNAEDHCTRGLEEESPVSMGLRRPEAVSDGPSRNVSVHTLPLVLSREPNRHEVPCQPEGLS
jgi:hypothetical protein